MNVLLFILTAISIILLLITVSRLSSKLDAIAPNFNQYEGLILIFLIFVFSFSYASGITVCKSETDTIKDYNKGLYQEKITYESIDGNIIPQDTTYIFKHK